MRLGNYGWCLLSPRLTILALAWCGSCLAFGSQPTREIYGRQRLQKLDIPKVAIMFLTRGDMPHENAWANWLNAAKWLVPPAHANLEYGLSDSSLPKQVWLQSSNSKTGKQHYLEQALFNIYVHAPPHHTGYAPDTVFRDRSINDRVQVVWGEFSMVAAMRLLLRAALADLLNQRFMYACEHTIPLYPPTLIYQQLMGETKSRINACPEKEKTNEDQNVYGLDRWNPDMLPLIPIEKWAKSSQWAVLSRALGTLIDSDEVVVELFARHCLPGRRCVGDEHYLPTVLAYHNAGNQTSCCGNVVSTTWAGGDSPMTFTSQQIELDLILALRQSSLELPQSPVCQDQAALRSAEASFVRTTPQWEFSSNAAQAAQAFDIKLLGGEPCALFARKFGAESAAKVEEVFQSCDERLAIAPDISCARPGILRTRARQVFFWLHRGREACKLLCYLLQVYTRGEDSPQDLVARYILGPDLLHSVIIHGLRWLLAAGFLQGLCGEVAVNHSAWRDSLLLYLIAVALQGARAWPILTMHVQLE